MSKKTFAIVSGIVGAVAICANTIISLFDIPAKTAICDAVQAVGMAVIAICGCFVDNTKQIKK
jgi:hypothetical protein